MSQATALSRQALYLLPVLFILVVLGFWPSNFSVTRTRTRACTTNVRGVCYERENALVHRCVFRVEF
jgi:hypothetical protein